MWHDRSKRRGAARISGSRMGLALLILLAAPAWAIDIQVDILGDPVPDGCTPGHCSLREAITLANSIPGPDRVLLPATPGVPLQLTIPGGNEDANATGDLDVLDDLEIIGAGIDTTVLVQTAQDRVLDTQMAATARLVLRGLTIQGGQIGQGGGLRSRALTTIEDVAFVGNTAAYEGGAVHYMGGYAPEIAEYRLVLRRVRFESNAATQVNNDSYGGALHATSLFDQRPFVLIEDCDFLDNESKSTGGAIHLSGSINWYGGGVLIRRSAFSANRAAGPGGAAIYSTSSGFALRIEDSRFDDNVTSGSVATAGGAIALQRTNSTVILRTTLSSNSGNRGGAISSTSALELIDSHLVDNAATRSGGALWSHSTVLVDRSTFESNRVTSEDAADNGGGAIGFSGTQLTIQRSTFQANRAYRGGAISLVAGRLQLHGSTIVAPTVVFAGSTGLALRILDNDAGNGLVIANTILSGTCTFPGAGRQLASAFNNIEAPGNSCRLTSAALNGFNQVSATNAQVNLGPLADNGGPTPTRQPGAGSIAINQASSFYCTPTDQRRYARTDGICDIGAVEVGAIPDELFRDGFD